VTKTRYPQRHEEGYRYIRSQRAPSEVRRVALWERRDGRMRRVGTAQSEREAVDWLNATPLVAE
jgi:hypothetical protein